MLSLLILIILCWQFYIGYSRGIILQSFYFLGSIVALFIAKAHYQTLAQKITLWLPYSNPAEDAKLSFFKSVSIFDLSEVYYAGAAFVMIFIAVYCLVRLIGILVHFAPVDYFDAYYYKIISGLLAVIVAVFVFSMVGTVLATIPFPILQSHLASSHLMVFLINHLPIFSHLWQTLWVDAVL
ncbi:hypothetical protein HMPREF9318_01242 [Streptococcus urinalis FB127-CNA-2]|uniref:CvpA family protein n=1 Tax=Streptococcus urinalis 2285-97 TaxID=764291 RepID=G5KC90_9STRE|nr:CvpA family protein [Streptococcus urinalis]EHJ55787.1 CvpA family protein [Streptococcus urinalis 2285-97]EKS19720.1 hypothetical protein HMPREF9318_01242 [Streptococcus urinalis FB127-CNA-2]VEF31297.1 colicin V production protein [Streptococcus urinalis]